MITFTSKYNLVPFFDPAGTNAPKATFLMNTCGWLNRNEHENIILRIHLYGRIKLVYD